MHAAFTYSRNDAILAGGLLLLCLAVFADVRTFEFVNYDDPVYVGLSPESRIVSEGLSQKGLAWIWTASAGSLWEPFNYLSHMLDVEVWGNDADSAHGHHLVNLCLHALNAVLAYLLFLALSSHRAAAWFAAAAFAIHPMRAESVAWISERKGVLSTTFVFIALLAYTFYATNGQRRWFIAVLLASALAMMTKPSAVVIPLLMILLDMWPLKRCGFEDDVWQWPKIFGMQLREKSLTLVMACGLAAISIWVQYGVQEEKFIGAFTLAERLRFAPAGFMFYLQRTLWPTSLAIEYAFPRSSLVIYGCFVVLILAVVYLVFHRQSYWPLITGCLWFAICWLPVSGLAYVGSSFTTDRYSYLAHAGLFFGVAQQVTGMLGNDAMLKRLGCIVAVVILIVWLPLTRRQTATWKNDLTLFQQTIKASPDVATGYTNLGVALERRGRSKDAIPLLEKGVQILPGYLGCYNLARLYSRQPNRRKDAKRLYKQTVEINPQYAKAWHNLGLMELEEGNTDAALEYVRKSCELLQDQSSLFLNTLAEVHIHRQEPTSARNVCEQAMRLPIPRPEVKAALEQKLKMLRAKSDPAARGSG